MSGYNANFRHNINNTVNNYWMEGTARARQTWNQTYVTGKNHGIRQKEEKKKKE